MDTQSDFEREIAARIDKVESALRTLSDRVDGLASARAQPASSARPAVSDPAGLQAAQRPKSAPRLHRLADPSPGRGADWWLARAGAGLTVVAVILLYQYAVGHGWITPWVRVLTGALVGAGLMGWGRKLAPPDPSDALPVALRELMMGAALAIWYITAFAASARYHLIPLSASRYLFLFLSIAGGTLSLRERRSGLALLAVTAGFLGPVMLADVTPSIPSYGLYIAVLGGLSVILYLMRGWQSVLWISFLALSVSLSLHIFQSEPVLLTCMAVAMAIAYTRAPTLRRGLVVTGAERYAEPLRSRSATHWLTEAGRFLKLFSPAAGALDSLSVWLMTLSAPLVGLSLLARAWPRVNDAAWGGAAIILGILVYRVCRSRDETAEMTHVEGAASVAWATFGMLGVAHGLIPASVIDHGTIALAIFAIAAIGTLAALEEPRFVAATALGRLMAGFAVLFVLFNEAAFSSSPVGISQDSIKAVVSAAELIAIAAGVFAWRDMRRRRIGGDAANVLVLMSYGSLMLVDARVLGAIWEPLVTATFAIAGTTLLIMNRKENDKLLLLVGGATLALVMLRLFFVDLAGVDTIWRVVLFLGVGALFLFTSRRLQVDKHAPPESA